MKTFLIETVDLQGLVTSGTEYTERGQAIRVAERTFRSPRLHRTVRVLDADGDVIFSRDVLSRFKR